VITAAKRGARPWASRQPQHGRARERNAEKEGVADKAPVQEADLFETDLSEATVISMFLLPTINMMLRPSCSI